MCVIGDGVLLRRCFLLSVGWLLCAVNYRCVLLAVVDCVALWCRLVFVLFDVCCFLARTVCCCLLLTIRWSSFVGACDALLSVVRCCCSLVRAAC